MPAQEILYQCGLIWQRPYDTCSSITEEGKRSAAFNGSGLSSKAYWLFHAWQWESSARDWKGSLPDSSNMPDWAQGELQLESLTSNLCILVKGYWHLSGSHHTMSGLKLLEIKTCSPSTWLFITSKKASQSIWMVTLLETYEMQPRWEYEVVIISPPEQRQISSLQSNRVAWLVGLDVIMACDNHDQHFIRQSREAINLEQM